jgi:hypothetical protein
MKGFPDPTAFIARSLGREEMEVVSGEITLTNVLKR